MVLSIDSGFGTDDYSYEKNGKIIFEKDSAIYAEAPIDATDMPLFEGKRYYIGEEALMEDSESIINVIDYKNHEKFGPLSVWVILNKLKLSSNDISKLYITLSLAQKDYALQFLKRITKFKVNGELFDFTDKIVLVPQGVSAKYAIDHIYYKENKTPTYAIVDIGQLTTDIATIINGKVRFENATGESNEGIIKIIQKIQEYIARDFKEIISIKEAQNVLKTGKYDLFGEHDLSDKIKEFTADYNKYIISMLKMRYKNIFKKYSKIYFIGGGSYFIDTKLLMKEANLKEGTVVIPKNAEYLNSLGGLYLDKI